MTKCSPTCLLSCLVITLVLAGTTVSPAYAQYRPLPAAGSASASQKGENYHVEIAASMWRPDPNIVASSDGLAITGTTIDAQTDLGIQKKRVYEFRIVLRPAARHKFRFAYLPLTYTSTATLDTTVYFNGRQYPVSAQIASDLQWKTYRIGYEYDFVSNRAGFLGVILEAKATQAQIQLTSAVGNEFAKASATIPAIGVIGRVYLAPGLSVTGEYSYFKMPERLIKDINGHYREYDVYATYNFTNNVGAQAGYRKIDVGVTTDTVYGSALLSGTYIAGVVRF